MYCVDLYSRVRRACPVEGISHRLRLRNAPSPLKPIYSDNALIGIPDVAMKPPSAVITLPDNYVLPIHPGPAIFAWVGHGEHPNLSGDIAFGDYLHGMKSLRA